jgi:hypothetical protein
VREDVVALELGVDDLADHLLVGDTDDQAVLMGSATRHNFGWGGKASGVIVVGDGCFGG